MNDDLLLGHEIGDCPLCSQTDVKIYPVKGREDDFEGHARVCWDCYADAEFSGN